MLFKILFTNVENGWSVKFIVFYPLEYSLSPSLGLLLDYPTFAVQAPVFS